MKTRSVSRSYKPLLRIFLLRHGETEANKAGRYQGSTDYPLSDTGRAQAKEVAGDLSQVNFAKIFTTPLSRAQETTKIVAPGKAFAIIPEFTERHFGDWENMTYTDIKTKYGEVYRSWLKNPRETVIPGALTFAEHNERIIKGLSAVEKEHQPINEENFLIVAHGGTNRMIMLHYFNLDTSNFWRIKQDNCCVNIIEVDKVKNYTTVCLLNYTRDVYNSKQYRY